MVAVSSQSLYAALTVEVPGPAAHAYLPLTVVALINDAPEVTVHVAEVVTSVPESLVPSVMV